MNALDAVKARALPFLPTVPALVLLSVLAHSPSARAQDIAGSGPPNPYFSSVPTGTATREMLALTLNEAVARALEHNLGVLNLEQDVEGARGRQWEARSDLLPRVSGRLSETVQRFNLEVFGFSGLAGIPQVVGPFGVFDARVALSQPLLDLNALFKLRRDTHRLTAARFEVKNARDLVILVTTDTYLQAVMTSSRIEATRAQLQTAQALFNLATDLKQAGQVASIEVLRAQIQLDTQRQRVVVAENDFEKQKLRLARVIGLPLGQPFVPADRIAYGAMPTMSFDEALQRAYQSRADFLAARARVDAAEADRRAAQAESYPTVQLDADYGALGRTIGGALPTYAVSGSVRVPVFQGGKVRGKVLQAGAVLARRRAELEDFKARLDYDVRAALLDMKTADNQLQIADNTVKLAREQLLQAQDRFAAGVAGNIDVIQAQESVATATEQYLASLYAHNVAKGSLIYAIGIAEESAATPLGGTR